MSSFFPEDKIDGSIHVNPFPIGLSDTQEYWPLMTTDGLQFIPFGMMGFKPKPPHGKILFLHGWMSDGSGKHCLLSSMNYDVETPSLSNWWFPTACNQAQKAYDEFKPDLVVGSSRGGAVAMNINTGNTPLVLLAPAWKQFGNVSKIEKPYTIIIHSKQDSTIPFQDSVRLIENSVEGVRLWEAGDSHRLNCKDGRGAIAEAVEWFVPKKD